MVIKTNNLNKEIITEETGRHAFTMMDVSLIRLNNDTYKVDKKDNKETAIQLVEGELDFKVNGKTYTAKRGGVFEKPGFVLHIPSNIEVELSTKSNAEILIISTTNSSTISLLSILSCSSNSSLELKENSFLSTFIIALNT